MILFLSLVGLVVVAVGALWLADRRERSRFVATLSEAERGQMQGFCSVGHSWRKFRAMRAGRH